LRFIDLGAVTKKKIESAEREAAMPAQQPGVLSGHVVLLGAQDRFTADYDAMMDSG
jgi:hypothetical protein